MAVTCKNCGGAHAIWECKRPATKSTVRENVLAIDSASAAEGVELKDSALSAKPPVDTNPPQGSKGLSDDGREVTLQRPVEGTNTMPHANGVRDGKDKLPSTQKQLIDASSEKGSQGFKSPVGQTPKFDKKAWSRAYMKIWMRNKRAKLKLERENAK